MRRSTKSATRSIYPQRYWQTFFAGQRRCRSPRSNIERDAARRDLGAAQSETPPLDPKEVAAKVKDLEQILETGSPAKVRQTLSKIISRVTLEFKPSKKSKRGQRFEFVKETIEPCTQQWVSQRNPADNRSQKTPHPPPRLTRGASDSTSPAILALLR